MIKIKKKIREEKPATEHSQCPIARTVSVLVLKTVQTFLGIKLHPVVLVQNTNTPKKQ